MGNFFYKSKIAVCLKEINKLRVKHTYILDKKLKIKKNIKLVILVNFSTFLKYGFSGGLHYGGQSKFLPLQNITNPLLLNKNFYFK